MTQTSGSGGREAKYTDSHLLVVLPGWRQREQSTPSHAYLAQSSTVLWGALASRTVVRRIGVAVIYTASQQNRLGHGAPGIGTLGYKEEAAAPRASLHYIARGMGPGDEN
jgi:hypothetical protein